ncbi:restriction endonuclease subunit S [Nocardia sp. NBC_00508]|uniref:restriction endonuclease subunit S n=1 Tax=Nocardia sp. NBC_00508 TaxID=2975992 RepID=UPI002E80CE1F|nr:restriction endonuclease subunit S [Nocardia sp. NBC_00508]WUD68767.1 restriction endonuclease subunit S [Nocardia sp. NBC_00508]
MSELPEGWTRVPLRNLLAQIEAGKSFGCEPRPAELDEWGIIKVSAMTWGKFLEHENKAVPAGREIDPRHEIQPGDILVSRANTAEYVGAPVLVGNCRKGLLLSDKSLRLIPAEGVDKQWLTYALSSPTVRQHITKLSTGTKESMRNISQAKLLSIEVPKPPLKDQHRLVATLDYLLSRVDAGMAYLESCDASVDTLHRHVFARTSPSSVPAHWDVRRLDEIAEVRLGRQRSPKNHTGSSMRPYLRAANVGWQGLKLGDVMEMNFTNAEVEVFRLQRGDLLLSEASGSVGEVGKPAMWNDEIEDCCFQNTLLRVRAFGINPLYLFRFLYGEALNGRFGSAAQGVNIHHLGAARLSAWQVPVPPYHEQEHIATQISEDLAGLGRLQDAIRLSKKRADTLRRSLLSAAFSGLLFCGSSAPSDGPVDELLDQSAGAEVIPFPIDKPGDHGDALGVQEVLL